LTRSLLG